MKLSSQVFRGAALVENTIAILIMVMCSLVIALGVYRCQQAGRATLNAAVDNSRYSAGADRVADAQNYRTAVPAKTEPRTPDRRARSTFSAGITDRRLPETQFNSARKQSNLVE